MSDHSEETGGRQSFGAYLRETRIKNGVSVEDICRETRLSRYMVESIEAGNRSDLPEDVLLKSFVRAMAESCGADGDKAVGMYLEEYPPEPATSTFYSSAGRRRNLWLLALLVFLILLAIGALSFFFEVP